jgi:hypothetical protein
VARHSSTWMKLCIDQTTSSVQHVSLQKDLL